MGMFFTVKVCLFQIGERNQVLTEKVFGFDPCFAREHPGTGFDKRLANLWSRKKITKKAHAVRGQEDI
jgi:hypothetical protein